VALVREGSAPPRAEIGSRHLRTLSRGGWGNADVLLLRGEGAPIVVKDFAPRRGWVRATFARRLVRREQKAYRALSGMASVPRLLGSVDELGFALEYRPGRRLSREIARRLPEGFLEELRGAVETMHRRGVVHLDLRHRGNILAGDDGRPVLLDFASSLCVPPGGALARLCLPLLSWIDRRALRKWERRLAQADRRPPRSASGRGAAARSKP
jgi:hypothetical protein